MFIVVMQVGGHSKASHGLYLKLMQAEVAVTFPLVGFGRAESFTAHG